MIRFFLIFAFVLGSAQAANATICTIPTTLVNGSIVDAAQLNGNFTSLQSCGNAVDNTNIGGNGIYASQIKPTSAALASFGGTFVYAFPAGLNVNGALLKANAGLTVVGTTNLAATTFSVAPTMSGANITAGTIPTSALASGGFLDTSATAQSKTGSLTAGGLASNVGSTTAYVPPIYSQFGVGRGATAHIVQDQATAGINAVGVTFTGPSIFTSALTYTCLVYDTNAAALITSGFTGISGTGFTFGAVAGRTYTYVCTGT